MKGLEKTAFARAARGELGRPLFEPAIYEHKAALLGCSVSELARSADLLTRATLREIELYAPDAVTVGVDVYNVEAEALGAAVNYDVAAAETPSVSAALLSSPADWKRLSQPNPEKDGRLPLFLEAAQAVRKQAPDEVLVRGAVSGPFSLAATLLGFENLLMSLLDSPSEASQLLDFASRVTLQFAEAYLRRGVLPVIFDSRCAPPLLSPAMYEEFVRPLHEVMVRKLRRLGAGQIALIVGGDTTELAGSLRRTGADYLLCDAPAKLEVYLDLARESGFFIRKNLDAGLIQTGPVDAIVAAVNSLIEQAHGLNTFVVGTGIVPYHTPVEHVQTVRQVLASADGRSGAKIIV